MRSFLVVSAIVGLAGCSDLSAEPATESIAEMLAASKPEVCAAAEVQATALEIINADYGEYLDQGGEPAAFQAVSATGVDPAISEVRCKANVILEGNIFDMMENSTDKTPITYAVRPALDEEGGIVVEIEAPNYIGLRLASYISSANDESTELAPHPEPTAPEAEPAVHITEDDSVAPVEQTQEEVGASAAETTGQADAFEEPLSEP
jgi:hypothetical protein